MKKLFIVLLLVLPLLLPSFAFADFYFLIRNHDAVTVVLKIDRIISDGLDHPVFMGELDPGEEFRTMEHRHGAYRAVLMLVDGTVVKVSEFTVPNDPDVDVVYIDIKPEEEE